VHCEVPLPTVHLNARGAVHIRDACVLYVQHKSSSAHNAGEARDCKTSVGLRWPCSTVCLMKERQQCESVHCNQQQTFSCDRCAPTYKPQVAFMRVTVVLELAAWHYCLLSLLHPLLCLWC
jgi:hypothetical protein